MNFKLPERLVLSGGRWIVSLDEHIGTREKD
jgi:hypothetical protein